MYSSCSRLKRLGKLHRSRKFFHSSDSLHLASLLAGLGFDHSAQSLRLARLLPLRQLRFTVETGHKRFNPLRVAHWRKDQTSDELTSLDIRHAIGAKDRSDTRHASFKRVMNFERLNRSFSDSILLSMALHLGGIHFESLAS